MLREGDTVSADLCQKKELLKNFYCVYSDWVRRFPLACRKGCAACCTQSVTMTSLEGEIILDFIKVQGREKWLRAELAESIPGKSRPLITTNQFAEACLNQLDVDSNAFGCWDFTPCIFLEENICSIYEVRPFGCRSFGSIVRCTEDRTAEMAPIHLTVNTVLGQIIEHLNSDNGYWAGMMDILYSLVHNDLVKVHLTQARSVPGFLLEPQEVREVHVFLKKLREQSSAMGSLGDLIDNFMPIL